MEIFSFGDLCLSVNVFLLSCVLEQPRGSIWSVRLQSKEIRFLLENS